MHDHPIKNVSQAARRRSRKLANEIGRARVLVARPAEAAPLADTAKRSALRRLFDEGVISPSQHEAGIRFSHSYLGHLDARTSSFGDAGSGGSTGFPVDRMERQAKCLREFRKASEHLSASFGINMRLAVEGTCLYGTMPTTCESVAHLAAGLDALAAHYGIPNPRTAR